MSISQDTKMCFKQLWLPGKCSINVIIIFLITLESMQQISTGYNFMRFKEYSQVHPPVLYEVEFSAIF